MISENCNYLLLQRNQIVLWHRVIISWNGFVVLFLVLRGKIGSLIYKVNFTFTDIA